MEAEPHVVEAEPHVVEAEPLVVEAEPLVVEAEPLVVEAKPFAAAPVPEYVLLSSVIPKNPDRFSLFVCARILKFKK